MPGQYTGRRGSANEYIKGLIETGRNNSDIVDFLRTNDMGYRLSDMYSDVNRVRLEAFGGEGLKNFSVYTQIPKNLMREWQGETDFKYRVVVQYEYAPASGGDTQKGATTLYYNKPPTISGVLEDWDARQKTIEGGFGSNNNVSQIEGVVEINYFYNVPKE